MIRSRRLAVAAAAATAAVLAALGAPAAAASGEQYRAELSRAVGLYVGSDVRVLGVRVGEVTGLEARGELVQATFEIEDDVRVPASARAVVVAPTLVSDRHLELTPPYDGGPELAPGSLIPLARTAVPVEVDEVFAAVGELATALGPQGANRDGALDQLVRTGATALDGNGVAIRTAVEQLSAAVATVDGGGEDLAATLEQLATLTAALAAADEPVRELSGTLTAVADSLAAQRGALAGSIDGLGTALAEIRSLVQESGPALTEDVAGLLDVTRTVLSQEQALRETLNLAPVTLQNFIGTFDPQTSTLSARAAVNGTLTDDPSLVLCQLIASNGLGSLCPAVDAVVDPLEPLLGSLPQPLGDGPEFSTFPPAPEGSR